VARQARGNSARRGLTIQDRRGTARAVSPAIRELARPAYAAGFAIPERTDTAHAAGFAIPERTDTAHAAGFAIPERTGTAYAAGFAIPERTGTAYAAGFAIPKCPGTPPTARSEIRKRRGIAHRISAVNLARRGIAHTPCVFLAATRTILLRLVNRALRFVRMAARIISYRVGLLSLLREIQYTLSQLSHAPLATSYTPTFQALREECQQVLLEEMEILDELANAQALVTKSDTGLDVFAGRVSGTVDEYSSGPTRKQLRTALFKNKPLTRFRRPVLGGQLDAMADWPDTLLRCGVPALVALAPEAVPLIAVGQAAQQTRTAAQKRNRDFRDIGTRKQFIDKVNAARKELYGGLAKLPFQNPALPSNFADDFFYTEPPRDEEETIDQVKASIEELEAQLVERQALLAELEEQAAAEAQAEQERLAQAQAADELEAQAQALLAQAAALRKRA
jgi:hypothetical protein